MNDARDGHPVLQLFVDDAVAADDDGPGRSHALGPTPDDVGEHVEIKLPFRKPDDVEGRDRLAAHRVDVAQRVGGSDLAERVRVVHDRREEIDGVDDRQVVAQAEYSRIVGRLGSDDQIRMIERREAVQHVHQVGRAELRRSTGRGYLLREPQRASFSCGLVTFAMSAYDTVDRDVSDSPRVPRPDGHALAVEILQQRNRVLPGYPEAIPEHRGSDIGSIRKLLSHDPFHVFDAVAAESKYRPRRGRPHVRARAREEPR